MEAERRQVTVLFADMVGFTAFSEKSGEEAAFALMRDLSKLMDEAVGEHGGVIQGFTGDGIMAVFGAPVAFEDSPLRACRAALSILQSLKTAGPGLEAKHGVHPQLRIGLNSGSAVVGKVQEGTGAGTTVLGDTVNFAARLQALAGPDAAFISEATHQLLQGLVDDSFVGERTIKGKSGPQKVYRLNAIRHVVSRFEAAISRGLSAFVGREYELEVLERALETARNELRVVDLAAEPGMGKSRLLHELRQRVGTARAFILAGNCSSDGQQTPFLSFIEVVRGSFRISQGESDKDIAQKLELGLTALGLHSTRNLGLLLHLLGLNPPADSLQGLDGVLIGLRTRELLQQLLEARCRLSPVVMVIEDLHWIDSVSEELLRKIIDSEAKLRLLLLTTRRPEYAPPWLGRATVTKLPLEPLPKGEIRRLAQLRLGIEVLPDTLGRPLTEKAEGNPLFAEEIISFLTERGVVRAIDGKLEFDANAVAAALPASVQGVLTARIDRLAAEDRALLQAASVIGRQFDAPLLAAAVGETDINDRLVAMQALDLIHIERKSSEHVFKHALVRDALYHSLLSNARAALHLKTAGEIERRCGNRLIEVAEVLAYHYGATDRADKAFAYLSLAGNKSLGVYSLDEAETHFTAALALLEKNPNCAADNQVIEFLASYVLLLNLKRQLKVMISVIPRYLARIDRLGDDPRAVLIRHQYVVALVWSGRYREAAAMQQEISPMADRLGDSRSKAYSLAGEIHVSTVTAPKPLHEFEALRREAIEAASDTPDAYIQNWTMFVIGWEQFHRGRMNDARNAARELMQIGRRLTDPRSTGLGFALLTWIALACGSYNEALEYAEQSLTVAITPWDRIIASDGKGSALILLRRIDEGAKLLEEDCRRCVADGDLYSLVGNEGTLGVCRVLQGNMGQGIRLLEEGILRREHEGLRTVADWYRMLLSQVYLEIIGGNEKPPLPRLLKNLPIILKVMATASSRIVAMNRRMMENPHLDPVAHHVGSAHMLLGRLYKIKKKRALALEHLSEAQRILSQFGPSPLLTQIETALAELGR